MYRKINRRRRSIKYKHFVDRNKHHFLLARSKGGDNSFNNLLLMQVERHEAWHKIFGLMSAEEALVLLERVVRAKKHQLHDHTRAA